MNKRAVSLPNLPPELWDQIFHHATYVPGVLIPEIYEQPTRVGRPYYRKHHQALRAALVTKRYLVRVCTQWWILATPYLYRTIYIGRVHSLYSLCLTLQNHAKGHGTMKGVRPLGSWTQRLDVAVRDHVLDSMEDIEHLADIIQCLPNLAIVSFAVLRCSWAPTTYELRCAAPARIMIALQVPAASLRVLDWSLSGSLCPRSPKLAAFLKYLPDLRILHCPELTTMVDIPHHTFSSFTSVGAHCFILFGFPSVAENVDIAEARISLREVIIYAKGNQTFWSSMMEFYGTCLTSVQLYECRYSSILNQALAVIHHTCPHLRRLTIFLSTFENMTSTNWIFPPIQYLGLGAEADQLTRSAYLDLFCVLERVKHSVPTLRIVQLLDRRHVDRLFMQHSHVAANAFRQQLRGSAFRIEDDEGDLLIDRLPKMIKDEIV